MIISHSFGYDCCSKMFNICAADDHTVVYAAGSYINMFDINNSTLTFRKCAGNGGIGYIAVCLFVWIVLVFLEYITFYNVFLK